MILLLSPYNNAPECAAQIQHATQDKVKTVNSTKQALAALRSQEFSIVVADENLLESEPGSLDALVQRMEMAAPLVVDLACNRPEKVGKLVALADKRRKLEFQLARQKALNDLRSEFKSDVTGLLLSSEMALKTAGLSNSAAERLTQVVEIVNRMKIRLSKPS